MSSINIKRTDQSVKIIDKFYERTLTIGANEYDVVLSFFKKYLNSDESAKEFTAALLQIAYDADVPVVSYLEQLEGQNALQLSSTMSYYINNLRSNATLLGVGQIITPNYYAARNVVI